MVNYLLSCGYVPAGSSVGAFNFFGNAVGKFAVSNTENWCRIRVRGTYTMSLMWGRVISNTRIGDTVVKSRKNGVDGNQAFTIPNSATGTFQDTINSDALVTGDYFNTSLNGTAAAGTTYFSAFAFKQYCATNSTVQACGDPADGYQDNTRITRYATLGGDIGVGLPGAEVEAITQLTLRYATTYSNLRTYVRSNNRNDVSTVRLRVDGGSVNEVVSVPAAATGEFEDTVNTDVVASGKLVNFLSVAGGDAGAVEYSIFQITSAAASRTLMSSASNTQWAFGTTSYVPPESWYDAAAPTELSTAVITEVTGSLKNLCVVVKTNTLDGATTVRSRKNGANGNLSLSVGVGATGTFEDLANADALIAASLLNYQSTQAGTVGSIKISIISSELQQPSSAGSNAWQSRAVGVLVGGR